MAKQLDSKVHEVLRRGTVIPAHPLALTANRRLDERRQRALTRYYIAAGAGGLAVGVHTTQFAIRDQRHGLFEPVLKLAAEEMDRADQGRAEPLIRIGGICGETSQAVQEAELLAELRYSAGLLSLAALKHSDDNELLVHCRRLAEVVPVIGFYLQPAVGGRVLPYCFWREFAEIENVVAIKIAPFNRYQTLDVARAVVESGRAGEIALYTGNDDNILIDLLTTFDFGGRKASIVGGLLGHWAVWTRTAVAHLSAAQNGGDIRSLATLASQVTDANAALFDPSNQFRGCIAGLHEILRRQGLLEGTWCLDPQEGLSPGQLEEIDRVCRAYPHLSDDGFVR